MCLGNIVRSPLAEHMFRHLAEQEGLGQKYEVDSAGTAAYHIGDSPDARMRKVAADRGLVYSGSGRQFHARDFEEFDLIIPMDTSNFADVVRMAPDEAAKSKVRLMREFDQEAGGDLSVPDPYYGGLDGFEDVYDLIERSTRELLHRLEEKSLDRG
ncbi:MAG: low molecular weight phosphotyrosine protein phosphatase [Chloroflexi bacterium]|nr:low molecular weight phosphotyrosine protein phosphatase [Chloroflexota bacterium]